MITAGCPAIPLPFQQKPDFIHMSTHHPHGPYHSGEATLALGKSHA